ncbi:MAG: hypothetical protein GXP30_02065 [Verrucomicrobia bacterium]|nr:hypothetical protein [Verrucomicrobiota bacterium]
MKKGLHFLIILQLTLLCVSKGYTQLPNAELLTIKPAVAKAGTDEQVTISGTNLDDVNTLRFSDTRIKVSPEMLPTDEYYPTPRPKPNSFKITIPADVAPGTYEVRTLGYFGLSTARPFLILPKDAIEVREEGDHSEQHIAMPLAIETGVLGNLDNRKIDWYKIPGKKGERLLIQMWAERLDSKADGMLAIYDANGHELERNREHFGRDPLVDFTPQSDGDYYIAVSDILYRGDANHFYRLIASRAPHIDFVFPPAGQPGTKTRFTIYGRNLPGASLGNSISIGGKTLDTLEVDIQIPQKSDAPRTFNSDFPRRALLPGFEHRIGKSNATLIGYASAPVVMENPKIEKQKVTIPCEIAGHFDQAGDADTFRFTAKKDSTYWLETISDQMTSMADPFIMVEKITKDDKGKEVLSKVVEIDDPVSFFSVDNRDATNLDTLDAGISFKADQDGDYQITLINQLAGGSLAHRYRLAIRSAQHDFQVITTTERVLADGRNGYPAAPLVRRGGSLAYRVLVPRQDGFDGDISITATGLPKGVTVQPLILSGKSDRGFLVVKADANAVAWAGPIKIIGTATINGKAITHESRNASLVWGSVFSDARRVRSRFDLETVLSVTDKETSPATVAPAENKVWTVELNQKLEIPIKVKDFGTRKGNITVQVEGFPGMNRGNPKITVAEGKTDGKVTIDFKPNGNFKVEPGRYQFIILGVGNAKYKHNPEAAAKAEIESKRLAELVKKLTADAGKQKTLLTQQQKNLDQAKKNAAAASDDAARANLNKKTSEAQVKLDANKKESVAADARVKKAEQLKVSAEKTAKSLSDKAKEKSTEFASPSFPISVEVKPVPKPPEKKK